MQESERLAIAARMHVQLRRLTGRVTDTEWMARNLDYADDVVQHARTAAQEKGIAELAELASRLEIAMSPLRPPPPVRELPRRREAEMQRVDVEARYVGRLR